MLSEDILTKSINFISEHTSASLDDFMLWDEWALIYYNLNVEKHTTIRLAIKRDALNWEPVNDIMLEPVYKDKASKLTQDYLRFVEETGHGLQLLLLPQENLSVEILKESTIHQLNSGDALRICNPVANVKIYRALAVPKLYDEDKFEKWMGYIELIASSVEDDDILLCSQVYDHLLHCPR